MLFLSQINTINRDFMKLRNLLLFLCAWLPAWLWAENVPVGQAQELASDFFKVNAQTRNSSPQLQLVWTGEEAGTRSNDEASFYVFNRTDAPGFVIVAADDVAMPILGYSFTSSFKADNMVSNLKAWMSMYRKEIKDARNAGITSSATTRQAWQTRSTDVGNEVVKLVTAKWNQSAPYDKYTPEIEGVKAATGCVATAMAIVMKYYEWPPKGIGTLPDYTYRGGASNSKFEIEGHDLGHEYLWDKMLMEYIEDEFTDEEADAVAQLMYDCGIMMKMMYNSDGYGSSGAYSEDIVPNMLKYMQYDLGANHQRSDWYKAERWIELLKTEIAAKRPVIYGGSNDRGEGHQFVFDGYTDTNFFSVNWGWGGLCDGYYLLSALDPVEQGIGGNSGGGFIKNQSAVFGLQPAREGSKPYENIMLMKGSSTTGEKFYGLTADADVFEENIPFNIQFGFIMNYGTSVFNGVGVLSLFDKDGNLKQHISEELPLDDISLYSGIGYPQVPCVITTTIEPLDYIAASYHNNDETEWKRIYGDGETIDMIVVKEMDTSLETNSKFSYSKCDKVINITTLPGISYSLKDVDGVEATQGVTDETGLISIDTKALAAGTYTLLMVKDEYTSKEVSFIIGQNE